MNTRQDLILATIRTAIPAAVGAFLAWLISRIPAVADVIAATDGVLAEAAPGFKLTTAGLLAAACIGLVTGAYYWAAREAGKRWPIVERFLLGSVRQPVTYVDGRADGVQVITTLPDPSTATRDEYQSALEQRDDD